MQSMSMHLNAGPLLSRRTLQPRQHLLLASPTSIYHERRGSAAGASTSGRTTPPTHTFASAGLLRNSKQPRQRQPGQSNKLVARATGSSKGKQAPDVQPSAAPLTAPSHPLDVDRELWEVLDLCSDDELEDLYEVLHASSPFSPLIKSLVGEKEPALLAQRGRASVMLKVESRFRFLAAGAQSLLNGTRPGYRETLLDIRERLDVACSSNLATYDLETELFVHMLQHCAEAVQGEGWHDSREREAAAVARADGDGMGSFVSPPPPPPAADPSASTSTSSAPRSSTFRASAWAERLTAPFRFGAKELMPTLLKLGGAVTVSTVGTKTTQTLATQLISSHLSYQAALRGAGGAVRGAVAGWGKQAVLEAASKGLISSTARYSAMRGALGLLGPLMWGAFAVDLTLKSMGTDYARIMRAVFVLAQVRLVRTQGFVNPSADQHGAALESTT